MHDLHGHLRHRCYEDIDCYLMLASRRTVGGTVKYQGSDFDGQGAFSARLLGAV
jgi:hypothetical protein